jgi:MFS transporter, PPP family, 3-phenylpropionic acid transporter
MTGPLPPNRRLRLDHQFGGAARIGLYFASMFTVVGVATPYMSVWLVSRGLTLPEIAWIAAVAPLIRIVVGPVLTFQADRLGRQRQFLIGASWAGLGAWVLMALSQGFWAVLVAQILIAATGAALGPLIETLAVRSVKDQGFDYGRMRLWGSVSFIAASLVSGWLAEWRGIGVIMVVLVFGALLTALSAHLVPVPAPHAETATPRRRLRVVDAVTLVRHPIFLGFLLAAGLVQGAHAMLYVFSVVHWQRQGISNSWCGALWAIGVVAEILLFWGGGRYLKTWSPLWLLGLGAGAALVRWLVMGFDPPLLMLLPLQALHGLTFGAAHLGAIQFLSRAIPEAQAATAQAVYAVVSGGIFMAAATQVVGATYPTVGGQAYWPMAVMSAVSLGTVFLLTRYWRGGVIGTPA